MSKHNEDRYWDKVIDNKRKRNFDSGISEYKDLIFLFVKRDFIIYYKQTILGPIWYLIQPIFSTLIYMVIFGTIANVGTDSIPQSLFYFSGTMLWTYYSGTLKEISNVFFANKNMFGKIYFPRVVVPIASMISLLIKLGIQMVLFIAIYIFYVINGVNVGASARIILFPISIIWIGILACGTGMIISSITTKYRDIAMALDFIISLFMYATPVVYPLTEVPSSLKTIFCCNPLCSPMELFRYSFFGATSLECWPIVVNLITTVIIAWLGLAIFSKNEKTFVDFI